MTAAAEIEIDVEAVIATAAKTAVRENHPDFTEEQIEEAVNAARDDGMYQLMLNAVRPEVAAAILVRTAMQNARAMAGTNDG